MIEKATLARPYAKAVFEIAAGEKAYKKWSLALQALEMVAKNKQVLLMVRNKTVPVQAIAAFFLEVCHPYVDRTIHHFVRVLANARRLEVLPEIRGLYETMRQAAEQRVEVEISTPIILDDRQKIEFTKMLEKHFDKTVSVRYSLDENLLGGFRAVAGNYVIDGSLRGHLNKLKKAMGD